MAVSRFLPLEDAAPLFQACMEPERSDAVKTCAIRASLTFVQDAARFSWHKAFDDLAVTVAPRCRDILRVCFTSPKIFISSTEIGRSLAFDGSTWTSRTRRSELHPDLKPSAYMRNLFLIGKYLLWASYRCGERIPIFLLLDLMVWMHIGIGLSLRPNCGKRHSTSRSKSPPQAA